MQCGRKLGFQQSVIGGCENGILGHVIGQDLSTIVERCLTLCIGNLNQKGSHVLIFLFFLVGMIVMKDDFFIAAPNGIWIIMMMIDHISIVIAVSVDGVDWLGMDNAPNLVTLLMGTETDLFGFPVKISRSLCGRIGIIGTSCTRKTGLSRNSPFNANRGCR